MKRLRKSEGEGIRFFQCGEYGDMFQRPHHHAILFNYKPVDLIPLSHNLHYGTFTSPTLEKYWTHGFVTVSDVTFESACYVAQYVIKKVNGPLADDHYKGRMPEFITMSRRPGVGYEWYKKYANDLYNYDHCVIDGNFVSRPPKYYDGKFEIDEESRMALLKERRRLAAEAKSDLPLERRLAMAEHAKLKLKTFKERKYDKGKGIAALDG